MCMIKIIGIKPQKKVIIVLLLRRMFRQSGYYESMGYGMGGGVLHITDIHIL